MARLTKRTIDAAKPGAGDRFVWDGIIPCFGLKITPSGVRSYVLQYRIAGRSRRYTIGRHGAPWTPESARIEAGRLLEMVARRVDPLEIKTAERATPTLRALAERFKTEHVEAKRKDATTREYKRLLDGVILPALGSHRLDAITRADIARLHHDLRATPYQANRSLAVLSKLFNWAERHGLRPDGTNPCRHVERYKEAKRERFLSEAELARLGDVLAQAEREWAEAEKPAPEAPQRGRKPSKEDEKRVLVSPAAIAAVRLLIFTGARLSEILTLQWDHVDLERACLRLPDSKTGAKVVYLNPPARDVLDKIERVEGNPYVITGQRSETHMVNLEKPWRELRQRAELPDVRLHDLRHSFASIGAGLGQSLVVIGRLLGHTQAATTARYAHLAADPVRQAGEAIGARLAAAMTTGGQKAVVVPLQRKTP